MLYYILVGKRMRLYHKRWKDKLLDRSCFKRLSDHKFRLVG
jgi:hypothetical protein